MAQSLETITKGGLDTPLEAKDGALAFQQGPDVETSDDGSSFSSEAAFAQDVGSRHHKPIPEYEGIHRWDPTYKWTAEEEQKIVRKIDLRLMAFCGLTFFALNIDRGNMSQALSDDLLDELHMTTNDYNTGQTIFFLCFLAAEMPSQLISKAIGPERWIPIQMVAWSLVAGLQGLMTGRSNYFACRALLGVFEGGFIPDTILFLSYWYKSKELPRRLSFYWSVYSMSQVIGAFLGFGFLHVHINGRSGWRYVFAFEGLITGVIGIVAAFYLPSSPTQTKGLLFPNGWFSEHEEKIMVNRVLRDDPGKGGMHNRQALSPKLLLKSFTDYDVLPIYCLGLIWGLPTMPSTQYITLQLRSLGFDTFHTSLLTIPAYVLFTVNLLFFTWFAERIGERMLVGIFAEVWNLACLIALRVLPDDASPWVRWVLSTLLIASPYVHACMVALASRNAGSVRTRTVATAMYNMTFQAANIIGVNIYRDNDKPYYRKGNSALIGITVASAVLFALARQYYVWRNKTHKRHWDAMTLEQKDAYLVANQDLGNKRYDFRFIY
ncbi:hypothetical protein KEM52_000457 [Ascosphaera acerosa]|nr:hypothetical protein KEM52_000457 [Ascosphaera acerosa]